MPMDCQGCIYLQHFFFADTPNVTTEPLPVYCPQLFQQKQRGRRKPRHILQKNMGRQTVLRFSAGDGCRDNGRTKVISYIILDYKDRTDAALLGADHRVQVCIEQITTPDSLSHKLTS